MPFNEGDIYMLKGLRVTLRSIEREDLPVLWAFNNDLEVELASGGDPPIPQSLARLQARFEESLRHGERDGTHFAIECDGKIIGICDLFHFDETAQTCELGIIIGDKAYWGQGYGREAVGLLLRYAFQYRNQHKVWLRVNATNERAIRSYRASGFVEEGRQRSQVWSDGGHVDLVLMGVLLDEWKSLST
jgi:RimJ/RimL family protein N-acetyltransferase